MTLALLQHHQLVAAFLVQMQYQRQTALQVRVVEDSDSSSVASKKYGSFVVPNAGRKFPIPAQSITLQYAFNRPDPVICLKSILWLIGGVPLACQGLLDGR